VWVAKAPDRVGTDYTKCLYRQYADATFTKPIPRPADESYLGFLGPVLRAEVGDTITVTFRNACSMPTSMHPHGVFYAKDSEGAQYDDGTSGKDKADDAQSPIRSG
jgi:hephaestin